MGDVKGEGCKNDASRVRGVDKYKEKGVFKVTDRSTYKVEG